MPGTYLTPGVYIEEIPSLPSSIVAVETAIPVFIGYTEQALSPGGDNLTNIPTRITSLSEYEALYGGADKQAFTLTIRDTLSPSAVVLDRQVEATLGNLEGYNMYYQLQMYFANGGGPCYIASVGDYTGNPATTDFTATLWTNLEREPEITLLVFPDPPFTTSPRQVDTVNYGVLIQKALVHCQKMQDRFCIIDAVNNGSVGSPPTPWDEYFRTQLGSIYLNYGAAYYPNLDTTIDYVVNETAVVVAFHYENGSAGGALTSATMASLETTENATYVAAQNAIANHPMNLSPCGAMAGIYARTDRDRGVWKAPANTSVSSVLGPAVTVTAAEQETLNVDATTGKSINVIRAFTGKGTLVWGARTLEGNSNEWRYVPVRRLFIMAETSIRNATEFVVFEPNDATTWFRVKSMIENFLNDLWRQGALAGAKPEQAYFVKVGLGQTMDENDILNGRMIVEVGMAAVRPAEFIILRFSHLLQEA